MNFFQFESILLFSLFAFIFYLHGAFISKRYIQYVSSTERFFINNVLGFSVVLLVLFVIALFKALYLPLVIVVFSIIPLYQLITSANLSNRKSLFKKTYSVLIENAPLIIIIVYFILPEAYRLFLPDRGSDSVRYHLPYARFYVENHGLVVNEYLRYPLHSHNFNLAFALGFLFQGNIQGEVLARLFGIYSYILVCAGLFALVERNINKVTAIIAILLLANIEVFKLQMIKAYVDIGLAVFLLAAVYFLYLWQNNFKEKFLYFSAMMLGVALGTKYLTLFLVVPFSLWVFAENRNWKNVLTFFSIAVLVGSPWYIRNVWYSGNPIHPFAQDFFGYWLWSPDDIASQKEDLLTRSGVQRSFINFIKLPWLLVTENFFIKSYLGWYVAISIPLLLLSLRMSRFYKFLSVFLLANIVFWFFTSQIARYLIFAIPLLLIYTAIPAGYLISRIQALISYRKYMGVMYQVVLITLILYSIGDTYEYYRKTDKWLPLPENINDWNEYQTKQNKHFKFAQYLNQANAKKVFNVSDAWLQNTFYGSVLGDWYGIASKRKIFKDCNDENCVISVLMEFNCRYLLVGKTQKWFNKVNNWLDGSQRLKPVKETDIAILYVLD